MVTALSSFITLHYSMYQVNGKGIAHVKSTASAIPEVYFWRLTRPGVISERFPS